MGSPSARRSSATTWSRRSSPSQSSALSTGRARAGRRAGARLASAGGRALARGDVPAAVNLLERAFGCSRDGGPAALHVVVELGDRAEGVRQPRPRGRGPLTMHSGRRRRRRPVSSAGEDRGGVVRLYTSEVDVDELLRDRRARRARLRGGRRRRRSRSAWMPARQRGLHPAPRSRLMEAALERALVHAERAGDGSVRCILIVRITRAGRARRPTPVARPSTLRGARLELERASDRTLEAAWRRSLAVPRSDAAAVSTRPRPVSRIVMPSSRRPAARSLGARRCVLDGAGRAAGR